ncbi:MAG: mechanosensitive ion channel [Polyangiaceae bacterium]|nr:mechanosensitive ion channel [Polyangiaceae bacterium]
MNAPLARALLVLLLLALPAVARAQAPREAPPPEDLDRSTPQASLEFFLDATSRGRFDDAARVLDLRHLSAAERARRGPELARQLRYVLDRKLRIDLADVSRDPAGNPADGPFTDTIGEIVTSGTKLSIKLQRIPSPPGTAWVFSRSTVQVIDELYAVHGPGWVGERLPPWSHRIGFMHMALWQWLAIALGAIAAWLSAVLLTFLLLFVGKRVAARTTNTLDDSIVAHARGPLRLMFTLLLVRIAIEPLRLSLAAQEDVAQLLTTGAILGLTWGVMRVLHAVGDWLVAGLAVPEGPNAEVVRHGQRTRMKVARQALNAVVAFVGVSIALTQFELVRKVGVSLLASAGLVGVVLGIAAQKSIANLVAGLQLLIAQPIRIGDRVQLSGDVGWIEEITLTYVTMKTWDGRRRVFPITYFIENQFDNWTKTSPQKIASILVHADYRAPVAELRTRAKALVEGDPDWDGSVCDLVVTEAGERTITLRVTASAADGASAFALSCRVREALVAALCELDGGEHLPRTRVEREPEAGQER